MSHNKITMLGDGVAEYETHAPSSVSYENLDDIQLEQAQERDNSLIQVGMSKADNSSTLKEKAKKRVIDRNWWLQEYWRNKGVPQEQVSLQTGQGSLEVFNFGESLSVSHIKDFEAAFRLLAQLKAGELFEHLEYILIDNEHSKNPNSGDDQNGSINRQNHTMVLYPHAFANEPHRTSVVGNLLGTLLHEGLHPLIDSRIERDWQDAFGWVDLNPPRELPGGSKQYQMTTQPERCVTDYAQFRVIEDIADSFVVAIAKPGNLDREKAQMLEEHYSLRKATENTDKVKVTRRRGPDVILPKVSQPVRYNTYPLGI